MQAFLLVHAKCSVSSEMGAMNVALPTGVECQTEGVPACVAAWDTAGSNSIGS